MVDIRAVLAACPILAGVPDAGLDELVGLAKVETYAAGTTIYNKGASLSELSVIASGTVRLSSVSASGRESTLMLLDRGIWFGDNVFSPGVARVYGAVAHAATTLVVVPGEGFRGVLANHPQSYAHILDLVSRRLWAAMSVIEDDALRSVEARFARRLMFLVQFRGISMDSKLPVTFHLTREHIANMLGLTRQTVHKVIKQFESAGLVRLEYGTVTVICPRDLDAYLKTLD